MVLYSSQEDKFSFLKNTLALIAEQPGTLSVSGFGTAVFHIDHIVLSLMSRMNQNSLASTPNDEIVWRFACRFTKKFLPSCTQYSTYIQIMRKILHSIQALPQGKGIDD